MTSKAPYQGVGVASKILLQEEGVVDRNLLLGVAVKIRLLEEGVAVKIPLHPELLIVGKTLPQEVEAREDHHLLGEIIEGDLQAAPLTMATGGEGRWTSTKLIKCINLLLFTGTGVFVVHLS